MLNNPNPDPNNWIESRLKQAPWRTQAQGSSLVLAVVVLVAVIGALYLAQASRTAAAGRRLQELESQRQRLEQQNAQLRAEIAALRSVPRLTHEAEAQGFHQATASEVQYLVVRGIAPPPAPEIVELPYTAPTPAPEADVAQYQETLPSYLQARLANFREQIGTFFSTTFSGPPPTPTPIP
jgi:hypothetical protein